MKVLVIDDEAATRQVCSEFVQALGHSILVATDGVAGWELYKMCHPDVILCDWVMPVLNGLELCRRVRRRPGPGYTYFILMSARSKRSDFLLGMHAGADDYLAKPLDPDQLEVRLASADRVTDVHQGVASQRSDLLRVAQEMLTQHLEIRIPIVERVSRSERKAAPDKDPFEE